MEELLKNFDLEKEIIELIDTYKNPPFNWRIYELGIYKYNEKLEVYCLYDGQGTPEPLYNATSDYNIELKDIFDDQNVRELNKRDIKKAVKVICNYVVDQIEENEKN